MGGDLHPSINSQPELLLLTEYTCEIMRTSPRRMSPHSRKLLSKVSDDVVRRQDGDAEKLRGKISRCRATEPSHREALHAGVVVICTRKFDFSCPL